jgi:Fe-S cluster biogenesis protein NfuA/nitrite reductase/ring-hydroxylating ferredoxin subunit
MEFREAVAELDTLVQTLEREGDERALLLLELVDAIHRPALELIVAGQADHPLARTLLAMYDLAEPDEHTQVEEALDLVRPYIESHGGNLELLDVEDGVVRVRMSGSCDGCAASTLTLKRGIKEALTEHFPGFKEVVAEEPEGAPAEDQGAHGGAKLLQIDDRLKRPVFVDVGAAADLGPGGLKAVDVDGVSVLVLNLGGEVYALRNGCPVDGLPMEGGRLTNDGVLVCPWHNCAFDARSGKRVDDTSGPGLTVVPIALQDGVLRVAANVA